MKLSRKDVRRKTHAVPTLRFEQQRLTSFSGLLLFQLLFVRLDLRRRLRACFETGEAIYNRAVLLLGLIVHLLLGYRQLRDARYYRDDPMVRRLLGLARLPDVATVSRFLAEAGAQSVERVRRLCRERCPQRSRRAPRLTPGLRTGSRPARAGRVRPTWGPPATVTGRLPARGLPRTRRTDASTAP